MLPTEREASSRQDVNALLTRSTLYLSAGAMLASLPHSFAYCSRSVDQAWPLSLMTAALPEVSVTLATMRLRSGGDARARVWAALFLATSVAFTVRANLGDLISLGGWDRALVAIWPVWSAIGAAGLVEMRRHPPETVAAPPPPAPMADEAPLPPPDATPGLVECPPDEPAGTRSATKAAQLAALRAELNLYPERTEDDWAERLGCSVRTYYRRREELDRERREVSV